MAAGRAQLDAEFFPSRWERATKAERRYSLHMAEDGDTGSGTRAVANRMGTTVNALGPARSGLIGKGLIYAPAHGRVAFTVPGMADFIHRQYEQER